MRHDGGGRVTAHDAPLPYFYRLTPPTDQHELAGLEFRALTGDLEPPSRLPGGDYRTEGTERIAWARVGVDVARAAYVGECCRVLAPGADLKGMLVAARKLSLHMERFRVRVRKAPGVEAPDSQEIERLVANAIIGHPDLTRPAIEIVVHAEPGRWLLGELISRARRGWGGHEQRPHQYSSALPPRIARALVNLVAAPGESLIDPCCGVGTVLVEAADMGVHAIGCDLNPRVVEQAAGNLCHHRLRADLICADGRDLHGRFDGAVLDLPYGQSSRRDEDVCRGLVARAVEMARLVAVVTVGDMSEALTAMGAQLLGIAELPKGGIVRRVHWARGRVD